jgi:hypothetical protein
MTKKTARGGPCQIPSIRFPSQKLSIIFRLILRQVSVSKVFDEWLRDCKKPAPGKPQTLKGEMLMKNLFSFAMVGLLALAAAPAKADTLIFAFTSDHCTGGCSTGASNMGTITVSDVSTGVVSVHVTLQSGFGFVDTGAGAGASFFFRLLSNPTITYSGITSGWSIPNVIPSNQQAAGSYAGDGLSNQYEYALACNPPGSSTGCGSGGSSPKAPPLDFTVTASGLTAASFNDTGNASGSPFAADVISTNGNTGLIDASLCSNCTLSTTGGQVPEPTSIILMGTMVIGIASICRKKFYRTA